MFRLYLVRYHTVFAILVASFDTLFEAMASAEEKIYLYGLHNPNALGHSYNAEIKDASGNVRKTFTVRLDKEH